MSGAGCRPPVLLWPETCLPIWVTGALAHSAEGPLFGESNGTFPRLLFTSVEEAAHWPAWDGPWETVWLVVPGAPTCVHVCDQRPHLCKRCSAGCAAPGGRGTAAGAPVRAGCGAAGQGQGLGLACSASTYLLNTSSCWAVTFPSRPRLLEQKSLGPPHSPASGQS